MDRLFFDLRATHNPHRWFMPLTPDVCVGRPDEMFMFGGVGLASAIGAMERTTGRPLIWATAQYLSYAKPPSVVDLDVWVPAAGKYNSQARVIGHVGDKEIFTVNAALGARPSELSRQWLTMPKVPRPEDCEPGEHWRAAHYGLHSRMEVRVAKGHYGFDRQGAAEEDGRLLLWVRPRERFAIDSSMLAIIADHVPSGIGNALGQNAGGNSLDNTLRIRRIVPTEWVLCDLRILGVHGGFGHGAMYLFAQDGELLATASQSLIVRVRETVEDR
ncbi:acyl-CoA thioesterase domain-containing protein [Phenylobacterium sp.]|uniref:acyl-CoA thioesterase n=1 Tax=Phenylobacterium sp. TaxID=1871053 RepID=UPI0011F8F1BD|nr:acyl-CoA thioesterase domain-containing protein [Phenylobacterium sp.]THD63307.1 MAG: acyl-CoA thioesterase [Phenylobacterium sp.]